MEALSWSVCDTEGEAPAQRGSLPPTDVSWQRALPQMEVNTPMESYNPEGALLAASCGNRAGGALSQCSLCRTTLFQSWNMHQFIPISSLWYAT